ncbi:MAG TPA: hypothetical protein VNN18_06750 [Candidatus Xenobia bacterium]|nr:hypothetical protein [Candidatus Xenobia bacterium]
MNATSRALPMFNDLPGLEYAAYQLFCLASEEAAREPRQQARLTATAINPERVKAEAPARLAIPLRFQLWLSHLLWLEEVVNTLECRPADLTAAELAGLQAVARARARFLRRHRLCPRCDTANPRLAASPRCRRCDEEL